MSLFPCVNYKLFKGIDDTVCVVCLHRHNADQEMKVLPKCYHTFHPNCAVQWFNRSISCPRCHRLVGTHEFKAYNQLAESEEHIYAKIKEATEDMEGDY